MQVLHCTKISSLNRLNPIRVIILFDSYNFRVLWRRFWRRFGKRSSELFGIKGRLFFQTIPL